MRKIELFSIILVASLLVFSGIQDGQNKETPNILNPAFLQWQQVTSTIPWSPRDSHALVVYKDKMWLMAGLNADGFVAKKGQVEYWKAPHFSDVWNSDNGEDWNLVADKSPWGDRRSAQVVVFKDKMWLMAGWGPSIGYKNDIWHSEDGKNWVRATSTIAWSAREGHSLVVFKDKLWLLGGVNYDARETKNDVWHSEDGINWLEATFAAPWSPRWDHAATVYKDKLWLAGGMDLDNNIFKDVWSSEDGINWTLAADNPPWQARQGHNILAFQDKLWIIGRLNDVSSGGANDIWFSEDGVNWIKTKNDPPWLGREDSGAVVFKDKIWLIGGMNADWQWENDVWYSDFYTNLEPSKTTPFYPFQTPALEKFLAQASQVFKIYTNQKSIEVDLLQQKVRMIENGKIIKEFSVSTGAAKTPTPAGKFRVYNKEYLVFSKLSNCWLPYWVGFTADGLYGFHLIPICREGWRGEDKIGAAASLGCIRSRFEDGKFLYNWIKIGTPIKIY